MLARHLTTLDYHRHGTGVTHVPGEHTGANPGGWGYDPVALGAFGRLGTKGRGMASVRGSRGGSLVALTGVFVIGACLLSATPARAAAAAKTKAAKTTIAMAATADARSSRVPLAVPADARVLPPMLVRPTVEHMLHGGGRHTAVAGRPGGATSTTPNWSLLTTLPENPPPTWGAASAYDPTLGETVVFGGAENNSCGANNETLLFNGESWYQPTPLSPLPLIQPTMVYDPDTGDLVLFGGADPCYQGGTALSETTYLFNGTTWSISKASGPEPAVDADMAFDPAFGGGEAVLFGGYTLGQEPVGDTWLFNGTSWTQSFPASSPPAGEASAMDYDSAADSVLLFGGGGRNPGNNTWTFDGTNWTQQSPAMSPPMRERPNMAFDQALDATVLYGGYDEGFLTDTWMYSGGDWSQLTPATTPSEDNDAAVSFNPRLQQIVMFGGDDLSGSSSGNTWAFGVPVFTLQQTSNTVYSVLSGSVNEGLQLQGDQLQVSGGVGAPVFTTTTSISSPLFGVSSSGAITGVPDPSPGAYMVQGTVVDSIGDTGTWSITVNVAANPAFIFPDASALPGGTVGSPYSQQFDVQLSGESWNFYLGVDAPPGLSMSAGGLLSGTPTAEGDFNFGIGAEDTNLYGISIDVSLAVAPQSLSIAPATLPGDIAGYPYTTSLNISGGATPATFAVTSGQLPGGLNLSSAGVISGTTSSGGVQTFTVTATDGDGFSTSRQYTMSVETTPATSGITIAPSSLPDATVGTSYSQPLQASGGSAPYSYAITNGSLPQGFTLTSDGVVHGQWNDQEASNFTVTATDANGNSTLSSYELVVQGATLVISPATLAMPTIDYGQSDPQIFSISGGSGSDYQWQTVGGSLPSGMALQVGGSSSDPTLTITGTAQQAGTFSFTLNGIDGLNDMASQSYSLTVNPPPTITVTPAQWGKASPVGVPVSKQLKAAGGAKSYNFVVNVGALPAGLTLSSTGPSTALITGTPTPADVNQPFSFQVEAIDADGFYGVQNYNMEVIAPKITLGPSLLLDPTVGQAYAQLMVAGGGGAPYRYSVSKGSLPAGLYLDTSSGAITGTPTKTGSASFTIKATDANGYTKSHAYTVTVDGTPAFTSPDLALVQQKLGKTTIAVSTTGSYPKPMLTETGNLPAGLTFKDNGNGTATIIGKDVSGPGQYDLTITANNQSTTPVTQTLTIWVYHAPLLPASKVWYQGTFSKYTLTTQIPADLITITGEPNWATIAAGKTAYQIVISGTPPSDTPVGTYPANVSVQDLATPAKPPSFSFIVAE